MAIMEIHGNNGSTWQEEVHYKHAFKLFLLLHLLFD